MHIGAYRSQKQGYGHPLQLFMSIKVRKEAKTHGEKHPSRKDNAQKIKKHVLNMYLYSLELV